MLGIVMAHKVHQSHKVINPIVIKRGLRIGDLEAETDADLLNACFVDNGELELLMDVNKPESIVLGRTGSGKSALIVEIQNRAEHSKYLDPNDISIRYLEASDIIQFFGKLGIKLDLFYKILWRHILTIEFLKLKYDFQTLNDGQGIVSLLLPFTKRDKIKQEALSYLKEWGDKFWLDTDEQLKEVTRKLESDLKTGIGVGFQGINFTAEGAETLTEEQKSEILNRANKVVSQLQIKKLHDILDLLSEEVFDDKQQQFYLLIDKLDEEWASSEIRYEFVRALIEEIKTFRRISNAKVIVALRKDLLDIVFDKTRGAGFQQEKYESYLLPVKWTKSALEKLVEVRIKEVFKRQYTKQGIKVEDVFYAPKGKGQRPLDFIIDRSLYRPRDVIQYVNECLTAAIDKSQITKLYLTNAEGTYSEKRLNSLFEEWSEIYPCLPYYVELLRGAKSVFYRSDLNAWIENEIDELFQCGDLTDPCHKAIEKFIDNKFTLADITAEVINTFFRIGIIGVKTSSHSPYIWSDYDHALLAKGDIKRTNQIKIHKMVWRTLGITETKESGVR